MRIIKLLESINRYTAHFICWFALVLVLIQFLVVLLRHFFGLGFIFLQESLLYFYAFLFMMGAGYTLLKDGHVRVDIFYQKFSNSQKALVDAIGVIFFLMPFCFLIEIISFDYVMSSWAIQEGSKETSGIPAVFILKTLILIFPLLLFFQGLVILLRSFFTISDERRKKNSV